MRSTARGHVRRAIAERRGRVATDALRAPVACSPLAGRVEPRGREAGSRSIW